MLTAQGKIKEVALRELLKTSPVPAKVVGQAGGYCINIEVNNVKNTLISSRGEYRLFTLNSARAFLNSLGVLTFEVDCTKFEPGRLRKARPDRAEALRKTNLTSDKNIFDRT
nr:hypothetical protein [uncultured Massilia sp.]